MTIARVVNGVIEEMRDVSLDQIPPHKRFIWLPVEYVGDGPASTASVEPNRVVITRYSRAAPVPPIISDRQFFQQLAHNGLITAEEALAAVGPGTIPPALEALISAMAEADRFAARMLLTGATQFDRGHPLVASFAAAFGWSNADVDAFWVAASVL